MTAVDKYEALGIDRRTGIGGSDAPAVVGLSPFQTQRWMFGYKQGTNKSPKQSDAMRVGNILEPFLLEEVVGILKAEGYRVEREEILEGKPWVPHPDIEWMRASHDAVIPHMNANVQLKTSSSPHNWGEDWSSDVAEYVVPQLRHEMSVPAPWTHSTCNIGNTTLTDKRHVAFALSFVLCAFIPKPAWQWRKAIIAASEESTTAVLEMVGKLDMGIYRVERDEAKERALMDRERLFWGWVQTAKKWEREYETGTSWAKEHIL